MLLDAQKISLIYDFWKLNNEEKYLRDVTELSRKLTESDSNDAVAIQSWIPDLLKLVELWERQSLNDLDIFYTNLLKDKSFSDKVDGLLRFLYDIQSYELVKYLLEKNVQYYKQEKLVSSTMNAFHESCVYGFSQVCLLYIRNRQDINETFSLVYENFKTNKKEIIRNLTALQLVCVWSKYFPKRLPSYAHTVRILLNNGARVNMTSTELTTPLHWTCRAKHTTQLAQDLIEHGACVNACDKFNIQPIHYACWTRNQTIVELLLCKGAQVTVQDDFGRTPLHFLCMPPCTEAMTNEDKQQQYELMNYILNNCQKYKQSIDLTKQDKLGHTLLTYTCISQNLSLMKLLLEKQPDLINKSTIIGRTPLMVSIDVCFLNGIEYLLKQPNLERNACDSNGNTAVHYACMCSNISKRYNLLQLLINDKNGMFDFEKRNEQLIDPFMLCTIYQSIDLCRLLIEKNVSITKKDMYSRQPIHVACQMGNYELLSLLIKTSNIDINAVDVNNRNCLFYAISSGDEKIVNLLIENNVNIKIRDIVGDTLLHLAVQHPTNAYELTKCLLTKQDGKDLINESAADGMQPLLLAASCKQPMVVYHLLKNGADIKAVDNEDHTALHLACKSDCMECVFYLIEFGGLNVNELDCYEQTPLFYAFVSNNFDLAQYLMVCGAKINIRSSQNYLPIHIGILLSKNDEDFNLNLIDLYQDEDENILDDQDNDSYISPLLLACMRGQYEVVKHLILNYKVNIMSKCSNGHTALHYACLLKPPNSFKIIEFLEEHGCTYENVDEPKGSFLYSIIQYGDRQTIMYFIDNWLKTSSDINELHFDSTLLDLLYKRAQQQHHDLDTDYLYQLFDKGARLHSTNLSSSPCTLVNDCPLFYLSLIEYNCTPIIADKNSFILNLLNTISLYPHPILLLNKKNQEHITVCGYFLTIVQFAHYYLDIEQFYSTINQQYIPQLEAEQSSEEVELLRQQIRKLQTTPLKLSDIARKTIRMKLDTPTKSNFEQLDLHEHLIEFLSQCRFQRI
ncbi:unnamed protein product [Adineta steineri]|uniref:Uncharacterized protein n=1 Tax=Adineta steineri TaxID=433720 RepID=A0A818PTS7_9BILA|nr:unnamed protein product [Adineta steineri]